MTDSRFKRMIFRLRCWWWERSNRMAYDAARGTFGYGRLRSTETYAEANNRRALKMDDPPLTREEVLTAAGLLALYALVPAYVWLALRLLA